VLPLRVLEPCHESWSAMPGASRVRHCAACGKDVHDVTTLSPADAEGYVRLRGGASLCVRMLVVTAAVACGGPAKAPPAVPEAPAAPVAPLDTPAPRVVVVESMGEVIVEHIHFARATHTLPAETFPLIDATIVVLEHKPEIHQVAIEGHASSDEPDAQRLSEARANAVLDRMVAAGIDQKRLVSRGYGSTRPIADPQTEDGRTRNRRVEFKVLDEASAPP
jgi:outer membrane protein OmpA-like peptidoglycan-associated protein